MSAIHRQSNNETNATVLEEGNVERVLLTGATGFLGRALIRNLLSPAISNHGTQVADDDVDGVDGACNNGEFNDDNDVDTPLVNPSNYYRSRCTSSVMNEMMMMTTTEDRNNNNNHGATMFQIVAIGRNAQVGRQLESQRYHRGTCKFIQIDLSTEHGLQQLIHLCTTTGHFHYIVHCAALCSPWAHPTDFWKANVQSTRNLLEAHVQSCLQATDHDHQHVAPLKKFIFVGSPSVFTSACFHDQKQQKQQQEQKQEQQQEQQQQAPNHVVVTSEMVPGGDTGFFLNEYSRTKYEAERLCLHYAKTHSIPVIVLRPRALYGIGDTTLLPILLQRLSQRRMINLTDGEHPVWTQLTHVDDAAHAIVCAMETTNPNALGRCFNITGAETVNLYELLGQISHKMLNMKFIWSNDEQEQPVVQTEHSSNTVFIPRRLPFSLVYYMGSFFEMVYSMLGWYSSDPPVTRYNACVLGKSLLFDTSDARALLGYEARVPLDEGIEQVIRDWKMRASSSCMPSSPPCIYSKL